MNSLKNETFPDCSYPKSPFQFHAPIVILRKVSERLPAFACRICWPTGNDVGGDAFESLFLPTVSSTMDLNLMCLSPLTLPLGVKFSPKLIKARIEEIRLCDKTEEKNEERDSSRTTIMTCIDWLIVSRLINGILELSHQFVLFPNLFVDFFVNV
jgi:hypothetical protein